MGVISLVTNAPDSLPATRTATGYGVVVRTMAKSRYMEASSSVRAPSIMEMAPDSISTMVVVWSAMSRRSTTARRRCPVASVR